MARCRVRFSVAALVVLLAASPLRSEELPFPIDPDLTEPVTLRYGYQAGTTLRYRAEVSGQRRVAEVTSNVEDEWTLSGTMELVLTVQRVDDEGHVFYTEEVQNVDIGVTENGESTSNRRYVRAMEGVLRSVELSPLGALLDEERSAPEADPRSSFARGLAGMTGSVLRNALPEVSLEVGASWTEEASPALSEGLWGANLTGTSTATFLGYGHVDGVTCAVFEVELEGWAEEPEGSVSAEVEGPFLGRIVGHGYVYFDATAGRVAHVSGDFGMVGQFQAVSRPVDFTFTSHVQVALAQ